MKVLITGGSSLLGKYLYETVAPECELTMTWFTNHISIPMHQMDVCDKAQVNYVLDRVKPEVVIHCAAIGNVDFAETHFTETHNINVLGTKNVLEAANGARFIYISTNAVFDGNNPPYSETSERHPINRYGSIKRDAEDLVMKFNNWLIVRPFMLYGWPWPNGRQNWMTIIENKLSVEDRIKLVNDVYWQPTSACNVAQAIWRLIELNAKNEIYHIAGPDRITLYEFGKLVCCRFGLDSRLLEPVNHKEFSTIAPRPIDTTYDTSKISKLGISCQSVKDGLKEL